MGLITRMRRQTAVYWPPATPAVDEYGHAAYGTAVELSCRWEDVAKEFTDPAGAKKTSTSLVYVGQDLVIGGKLYLGELTDSPAAVDAWTVQQFDKLPNLKNTETLRTAYL